MSERKVINKYYPPDFDPEKLPGARKSFSGQLPVRMMLPMSVRCNTCGEYIYKGKKFNSRKETVYGEEYLGVRIYRFYMKCPNCNTEFTIKTDPKNSDYHAEVNCSRNFEPWKQNETLLDEARKTLYTEEEEDVMKTLENRSADSKLEMDIMEALDEIRSRSARNAQLTSEELMEHHKRTHDEMKRQEEAEDEEELKSIVFKSSNKFVRRIDQDSDDNVKDDEGFVKPLDRPRTNFIKVLPIPKASSTQNEKRKKQKTNSLVTIVPKAKSNGSKSKETSSKAQSSNSDEEPNGLSSLVDYD